MRKILTFLGSLLLIHCGARQRQPAAATSSVAYEGRVGSPATAAMAVAVMWWCCRARATQMFLQRPRPVARSPTCPARRSSTAEPKPAHHLRSCRFYGAGASVPHRCPDLLLRAGGGAGHRAGRSPRRAAGRRDPWWTPACDRVSCRQPMAEQRAGRAAQRQTTSSISTRRCTSPAPRCSSPTAVLSVRSPGAKFTEFLRALSMSAAEHRSEAELRLKKSSLQSAGLCDRTLDGPCR